MEAQRGSKNTAILEPHDYRNTYEDANPIVPDLTVDAQEAQLKIITRLSEEMYDGLSSANSTGEVLWTDFIPIFRSLFLKTYPEYLTYK